MLVVLILCTPAVCAQADEFLLIDDDLLTRRVRVAELNAGAVSVLDQAGGVDSLALDECIALIRADAHRPRFVRPHLLLVDGRRLPGGPAEIEATSAEALAWEHAWLGRLEIPIDDIDAIAMRTGQEAPSADGEDVIVLANGDRLEGIITVLGDPIRIEVGGPERARTIDVPLDRIAAVAMINPPRPAPGRRVFFNDGTILDVTDLTVGADGYVRFIAPEFASGTRATQILLDDLEAIVFDTQGVLPLGRLTPAEIDRPAWRYAAPQPKSIDEDAPLGPRAIEFRGPLAVRYELPAGCRRFAAEAVLPRPDRGWGDYELIIRCGDEEVYRRWINGEQPSDAIDIPLAGRELTIELTEGAHGPIRDRLLLRRPLLLIE
ncbi:MAG: hypothetical protein SYC29_15415 [Planctomycetota bacterium]|nr:hypothetical protein [Planctomycetota bacterium]